LEAQRFIPFRGDGQELREGTDGVAGPGGVDRQRKNDSEWWEYDPFLNHPPDSDPHNRHQRSILVPFVVMFLL